MLELVEKYKDVDVSLPEIYKVLKSQMTKRLYLFGNGLSAENIWKELEKYQCTSVIKGILVSEEFWDKESTFHGLSLEKWEEVCTEDEIELIIGFDPIKYEDNILQFLGKPFVKKIYIYDSIGFLHYKKWLCMDNPKMYFMDSYYNLAIPRGLNYEYFCTHIERFNDTYSWLEDELSYETMESYIEGHISKGNYPMRDVWSRKSMINQYFPEVIKFDNDEVIIDCGAFDGDTFISYLEHNGTFKRYYAFEPERNCYEKLLKETLYHDNVFVFNKGVSNESKTVDFKLVSGCGTIVDSRAGECAVDLVALDRAISDNEKVTFIKMDIEGSEMEALKGAFNIIRRDKPKLAICVYHKREDLIEIPAFIKMINPSYKLYLRSHWANLSELVLYAI